MNTEAVIMGSRGYTFADIQEVIGNLEKRTTSIIDTVAHVFSLCEFAEAFETASNPDLSIKVVLDME